LAAPDGGPGGTRPRAAASLSSPPPSGESAEEIAASSDRTPHAIEQSLCRSRKHLRAALERRGSTEAELRQYLAGDPGPLLRWHSPDPE